MEGAVEASVQWGEQGKGRTSTDGDEETHFVTQRSNVHSGRRQGGRMKGKRRSSFESRLNIESSPCSHINRAL
jgi:hypothetical protein